MRHQPSGRRPSIGITADVSHETSWPRYELRAAYADAVMRAGGLPLVLTYADDREVVDAWLSRVSGLVFTGGAFDIGPQHYGEAPREGLGPLKPERTDFELKLLEAALRMGMPVLGICGGMQLINVALGGSLHQDIALELPASRAHQQTHERSQPQHPVEVKAGSGLAEAVGAGQLMVNSTHHQAVHRLGQRLVATATSPDGVVEAIERPGGGFVMGVQWHPELLLDTVPAHLSIYRALVNSARDRRRDRRGAPEGR